jgi:hypothetical protein
MTDLSISIAESTVAVALEDGATVAVSTDEVHLQVEHVTPVISVELGGIGTVGGGGASVHSELQGLDADDHRQYLNVARGDVRYPLKADVADVAATVPAAIADHEAKPDSHPQYVAGPASSVNRAIARFSGTTGKVLGEASNSPTIQDDGKLLVNALQGAPLLITNSNGQPAIRVGTTGVVLFSSTGPTGSGVLSIANATTAPTADQATAAQVFVEGGILKFRNANTLGNQAVASEKYVDDQITAVGGAAPAPATVAPQNVNAAVAAVGTSLLYARQDHKHYSQVGNPVALGSAIAQGTANTLSRSDHVHPFPTAADVGAATSAHNHDSVYLRASEIVAGANISLDTTTTPGSVIISGQAGGGGEGGVTDHGMLTGLGDADHPIAAVVGLQAALDAKAVSTHNHDASYLTFSGASATYATKSHTHTIANTTGLQTAIDAKADTAHNHDGTYLKPADLPSVPVATSTSPQNITAAGAAVGTSAEYARADHRHTFTFAAASPLGAVAAAGTSNGVARTDHVHPYPTAAQVGAEESGAVAAHAALADPHSGYAKVTIASSRPASPRPGEIWVPSG